MTDSPGYLLVCVGPTCGERGGRELLRQWKERLLDEGRWERLRVAPVHCFGECATGPNVCVATGGRLEQGVSPRRAAELLERVLTNDVPLDA